MKKTLILILLLLTFSTALHALDTDSWYQYNGYSTSHSFKINFPTDWKARTSGDDFQGLAPENMDDEYYFSIQEFEGSTFDQAIQYYEDDETFFLRVEDFIFSNGNDLVAKRATYQKGEEAFAMTFMKRGSLVVALTDPNMEESADYPVPRRYNEIVTEIYNSFDFTDEWHQYIDYGEGYAFIFHSSLEINNLSNGVTLSDPTHFNREIFTVLKYEDVDIDDIADEAEGHSEDFEEEEEIVFHGIENAIKATYSDDEFDKELSRILVCKTPNCYSLTDVNIESNFPHLDYYDEYIQESLESFEFFDVEGEYYSYTYFPDIRDNHLNKDSINYLTKIEVIAGYPDGTFQPDGEINRAELTKMIVATVEDPDPDEYKDCFPDVTDEWFAPFICYAKEQGWVEGYLNGRFKPEQNINRVEAMKVILEVLFEELDEDSLTDETVADINLDQWYAKYFIFADNLALLDKQHILQKDDSYFYYPSQNISRKEVAETIYRSLSLEE